jgi:hypothetical protein
VDWVIWKTETGLPLLPGLVSLPVSPSYACPDGAWLPASVYRYPSMWSNERFSSISTTMCSIDASPLLPAIFGLPSYVPLFRSARPYRR